MTTVSEPFTIYVPAAGSYLERVLACGAGVVGRPSGPPEEAPRVRVHYENPGASVNVRTWADRCYHAADRRATGYPTHKQVFADAAELLVVGYLYLDGHQTRVEVNDSEKLAAWLGRDYLDDPEPELLFDWQRPS